MKIPTLYPIFYGSNSGFRKVEQSSSSIQDWVHGSFLMVWMNLKSLAYPKRNALEEIVVTREPVTIFMKWYPNFLKPPQNKETPKHLSTIVRYMNTKFLSCS